MHPRYPAVPSPSREHGSVHALSSSSFFPYGHAPFPLSISSIATKCPVLSFLPSRTRKENDANIKYLKDRDPSGELEKSRRRSWCGVVLCMKWREVNVEWIASLVGVRGERPSRPRGFRRGGEAWENPSRKRCAGWLNPYTGATEGLADRDPKRPPRAKLQEPQARARAKEKTGPKAPTQEQSGGTENTCIKDRHTKIERDRCQKGLTCE
ncbi:hypothetical protein B0H17DRAFT_1137793 [Mycena rosella]|uniref:Uncharacterized protein n=1 Tax=Mycena rosella TaxID=1033263 RepID=A0AAD7GAF5_MYCRO|nr:hypothetical protein B0H17DRAFT_1137793 [Mycena rosella]